VSAFLKRVRGRSPAFWARNGPVVCWEEYRFARRRGLVWAEGEEPTDTALRMNFGRYDLEIPFEVLMELTVPLKGRYKKPVRRDLLLWEEEALRWRSQEISLADLASQPGVQLRRASIAFADVRKRLVDQFDGDSLHLALAGWWPTDDRHLVRPGGTSIRHEVAEAARSRVTERFPGALRDLIPPCGDIDVDLLGLAAACLVRCGGDVRSFSGMATAAHEATRRHLRDEAVSRAYSAFGRVALASRLERAAMSLLLRALAFGSVPLSSENEKARLGPLIDVLEALMAAASRAEDRSLVNGLRQSVAAWKNQASGELWSSGARPGPRAVGPAADILLPDSPRERPARTPDLKKP
jgi:hypothetical protein